MSSGEAYRDFVAFCRVEGVKPPAHVTFSCQMEDRGIPPQKGTAGRRYFDGVRLRSEFDVEEEDLIG